MISNVVVERNQETGNTVVSLDGYDIANGISGFTVVAKAGQPTEMTVEMKTPEFSHYGEAKVYISEATKEVLLRWGWTPPEEP